MCRTAAPTSSPSEAAAGDGCHSNRVQLHSPAPDSHGLQLTECSGCHGHTSRSTPSRPTDLSAELHTPCPLPPSLFHSFIDKLIDWQRVEQRYVAATSQ